MSKEEWYGYAVKEAVASNLIEGYTTDADSEALCMQVLSGSLSQEEYIQAILEMSKAVAT